MNNRLPQLAWTRQFGSNEYDIAEDLATDLFGNIYVTGYSRIPSAEVAQQGRTNSWLARLDNQGNLLWLEAIGTEGDDKAHGLATDFQGNAYVCGYTTGAMQEGEHKGGLDAWLAKYDPTGTRLWISQIGTPAHEGAHSIAVDRKGQVYVSGFSYGNLETQRPEDSGVNAWLAKYDADGQQLWLKSFGTPATDVAYDLGLDSLGDVFVAGFTRGRIATATGERGNKQIFVIHFDGEGNQQWIREFGSNRDDEARSLAIDNAGNLYVTGITFIERNSQHLHKQNVFLTKIRANSAIAWTRFLGTEENDHAYGVAVDPVGGVYLAGYTQGELAKDEQAGKADAWLAKYNAEGEQEWLHQMGTREDDSAEALAVDAFGNLYLGGFTAGKMGVSQEMGAREEAWVSKFQVNATPEEQFHLLSDYLQQMNGRIAHLERQHSPTVSSLQVLADQLVSGTGDGRISGADAELLLRAATTHGSIEEANRKELAYIYFTYHLTSKGEEVLRKALGKD
jgi:DNA-binding beta-propeller fold protein YncE